MNSRNKKQQIKLATAAASRAISIALQTENMARSAIASMNATKDKGVALMQEVEFQARKHVEHGTRLYSN